MFRLKSANKADSARGFSLLELMIVVATITLLATIAVPAFMKAREASMRTACLNNLRQLSAACDQYRLDNTNAVPTLDDVSPHYIKHRPACPAGGTYELPGDADPTCSLASEGHAL